MKRRRIGIDVDGVLADFVQAYTLQAFNLGITHQVYGTAAQKSWDFPWPRESVNLVWEDLKLTYNWWMRLRPLILDAEVKSLNDIIRDHDVYFITSRVRTLGFSAEKQTELWLESIGIQAAHASVIATQAGRKGELCKALDIEAMLDDNVVNLYELAGSGIKTICRTWPYNSEWGGRRVNNLFDYLLKEATNNGH